tara:strand:+ start:1035 stop:2180 length:1146 start_codon:yes stop_codon:yes gene_type:complete
MKIFREIVRVIKQFLFLPKNITNFFLGNFFNDYFLSKYKREYSGSLSLGKKVIIYLLFLENGLSKSHLRTLKYFIKEKYSPIIVSNKPLSAEDKDRLLKKCWTLIERKNFGYDAGGHRDAILFLSGKISSLDNLILLNDSTWFPITRDDSYLNFIKNSNLDFIGATSHYGFERLKLPSNREDLKKTINFNYNKNFHYASYALSFSNKILKNEGFLNFWRTLKLSGTKNIAVRRWEIGITQFVINNKNFSHGSFINSKKIAHILKNFSRDTLIKISKESIIEHKALKKFKEKFLTNLDSLSKDEIINFIIILVSRQIIVFSLIKFLIEELNFPFLKKILFRFDKECSEKTYKIIDKLDRDIFEEIYTDIKNNKSLNKFLELN